MTHHVANESGLRPMRFGRAMHMDITRASDADLQRAIQTLDDYDTAGKASEATRDKIDDRIADINDEGDRRAGGLIVAVARKPLAYWHPATSPVTNDDLADEASADIADTVAKLDPALTDGLVPGETSAI